MQRVIFIGGVGSHQATMAPVVAELETIVGSTVEAYSFREAQQQRIAINEATVITHSAGMLLVRGFRPTKLIAITPPLPMNLIKLGYRFAQKEQQLLAGRKNSSQVRRERIKRFYRHANNENLHYPFRNILTAPRISRFDTIAVARGLAQSGVDVTLAFGEHDFLFRPSVAQIADCKDIRLIATLPGQHDELLLRPKVVLAGIEGPLMSERNVLE